MTDRYFLAYGSHATRENGMCAMEWVAYLAGESHTADPVCVSPVLRRFGIVLNDRLGDTDRQRLRPYLARCIGTAGDGRDPERLETLAEFVLRRSLPGWLDEAGLQAAARRVRELPLDLTRRVVRQTLADVRLEAQNARTAKLQALRAKYRKRWSAAAAYAADAADAAAAADAYAAAAAADAYAAAYAYAATSLSATLDQVYATCRKAADEALAGRREQALRDALDLFDRLLPTEAITLPVLADAAKALCRVPAA